jgi:hypothetical protein
MYPLRSNLLIHFNPSAARGESVASCASGKGPNYVFFVSFGQTQAGHDFDEAVYASGIVRWQSQPAQKLAAPMIQRLIRHD